MSGGEKKEIVGGRREKMRSRDDEVNKETKMEGETRRVAHQE